jgi:riboflavin transporter FmnP
MSSTKKICVTAICTALCYALPQAFHLVNLGSVFSPMHLPVLLCGLVCGWPYGAFCGVVGPLLSHLLSGMPSATALVYMVPELCAYGLFAGLLMAHIRTGRTVADVYLALIPTMVIGRVVGGVVRALFCLATAQSYGVGLWLSAYFVTAIPAIILQLVALPALYLILMKARLIPARNPHETRSAGLSRGPLD